MTAMTLALVLGFVIVASSGGVLRWRGRRPAGILLAGTTGIALIALTLTLGREAISQFMVGGLTGLPVLVASAWAADKDSRNRAREAAVQQRG